MAHTSKYYLAVDLGAESGRGLLGRFDGDRLDLDELHRFPNGPVRMLHTLHWDLPGLWAEVKASVRKACATCPTLDGIGVDTWGVDFGLIGRGDTLLANPVHYRDARTEGMIQEACRLIPRERLYKITGLQFMPFNTVFQLLALRRASSPLLDAAETLLMMPDLFNWLLTGCRSGEYTDASTTQLLAAQQCNWSEEICQALSIPRAILPPLVAPGTEIGPIAQIVADELNAPRIPVLAIGSHDTASAVAAVPVTAPSGGAGSMPDWCYLSSGTWSLLGVETPGPIINEQTERYNFTNEGGVAGTIRLLKNIMGLWLVQECRRTWARAGHDLSYDVLIPKAEAAKPFAALIDPDDASFLSPGDMPARIENFCKRTGQTPPKDEGSFIRCCLESLALKYRWTIDRLEEILGTTIRRVHVVGGGTKNTLLCQFTADACNRPVLAGPVEATAIGNILMQAMGRKELASLPDLRNVVARSFPVTVYEPRNPQSWDQAASRFGELLDRA